MTDSLFLRERDRTAIEQIASEIFKLGTEIWAYGSRVDGTAHDGSDLDLVVHFPETQPSEKSARQLSQFKQRLHDSTIPILIDVHRWDRLPESFQRNIAERHAVLWRHIE